MKIVQLIMLLVVVLFTIAAKAQQTVYYPKLLQISKDDMVKAKTEFADIIKGSDIYYKNYPKSYPKNVSVFDDRFEMTFKKQNVTFYFSDLVNYTIQIIKGKAIQQGSTVRYEFLIKLGEIEFSLYSYAESVSSGSFSCQLADYLFFFQYQVNNKRYDSLITVFKPLTAEFCELKVKPSVSEEQRKYLMLEPEAEDARSAQDKSIYGKLNKLNVS